MSNFSDFFGGGGIKSIQRGVAALSSTNSVNVTIAAVNPAYTELRNLGVSGVVSTYALGPDVQLLGCSVQLTGATTIAVTKPGHTIGSGVSVSWELTEYYPT